jgi:putative FmdB family regulatory protein
LRLLGAPAIMPRGVRRVDLTHSEGMSPEFGRPHVPTYDYQCRSCGRTTEVIHSMLEDGPTTCEICGGPLRRVIYPTGIIFKGAGFYKTDSRGSTTSDSSKSAASKVSSNDGSSKDSGAAPGKDRSSSGPSASESGSGGGAAAPDSAKSSEPG